MVFSSAAETEISFLALQIMVELVSFQKEQVAAQILQNNYIRKILNAFRVGSAP